MNLIEQNIIFSNENFILTNQRVLYWPGKNILILSDLHLGKAAHFRKNGIPIPVQISLQDIGRLESLLDYYNPAKLIIVGDLLHAAENHEFQLFEKLRRKNYATEFLLVRGNHDRVAWDILEKLGIDKVFDSLIIDDLCFMHGISQRLNLSTISGHIHPGIKIELPTGTIKLPCYLISEDRMILPAFSVFTGLDTSHVPGHYDIYAFDKEKFFEIP